MLSDDGPDRDDDNNDDDFLFYSIEEGINEL